MSLTKKNCKGIFFCASSIILSDKSIPVTTKPFLVRYSDLIPLAQPTSKTLPPCFKYEANLSVPLIHQVSFSWSLVQSSAIWLYVDFRFMFVVLIYIPSLASISREQELLVQAESYLSDIQGHIVLLDGR